MSSDLDNLDKKIEEARGPDTAAEDAARAEYSENMSNGMRAGAELVGCIGGGALIGWLLDGWLGTKPLFLIVMLMLGIVTGFFNVWRTTQNIGTGVGYSQLHPEEKDAKNAPDEKESD